MDYSHNVHLLSKSDADTAFILRMQLVYQLHIIAYWTLRDAALHRLVYPDIAFQEVDVDSYSLGIFGSDESTSDIDVGVRYAGSENSTRLHWVVQVLEDAYEKHVGVSSLALDVETYGNTETVQINGEEVYFMDTSQFTLEDFKQIVPFALASMVRNVATAMHVSDDAECDPKCTNDYCPKCSTAIASIHLSDLLNFEEFKPLVEVMPALPEILGDESYLREAQVLVADYVKLPYREARFEYYKLIKASEEHLMGTIKPNIERLTIPQIIAAVQFSAKALLYRKESYLLGPTITHVVRIMQGSLPDKYADCPTNTTPKPVCSLGVYGFVLSMLEQIGYIKRMQMTYCDFKHESRVLKCKKKLAKYISRFEDAIARLQEKKASNRVGNYAYFRPKNLPVVRAPTARDQLFALPTPPRPTLPQPLPKPLNPPPAPQPLSRLANIFRGKTGGSRRRNPKRATRRRHKSARRRNKSKRIRY